MNECDDNEEDDAQRKRAEKEQDEEEEEKMLDSIYVFQAMGNAENCWERMPSFDIPVPLDEVKWWDNHALITTAEIAWRHDGNGWTSCGPWPGGPVPANQSTLGEIKANYRK